MARPPPPLPVSIGALPNALQRPLRKSSRIFELSYRSKPSVISASHNRLRRNRRRHVIRRTTFHKTKEDRKSTRLNSSHVKTSYAVFCLKKKTKQLRTQCS